MKKLFHHWLLALAAGLVSVGTAHAAYPEKPVRILVGFPAGSTADLLARALAIKLADQTSQPFIIDNKPGAGSSIAAEAVARAPADGYTLLLSTTAHVINPSLSNNLKFDFTKDLMPVMLLAENPVVLIAPGNATASSVKEVVAAAKAAPGKMTFASSGNGTFTHLYGELFNELAGIKLTHVPYKGSTQAMTDVITGDVDLSFTPSTPVLGQIKAGKLKALALIGRRRMAALPNVPTFAEAGIAGFDSALWFGLSAPAGTPRPVVDKLAADLQRVLALPDVKAQLEGQGIDVAAAAGPAPFGALITRELAQWAKVVKTAGVKVE
jgi:tripartite-type tricarboxylate transporter receptor subunit TctC